MTTGLETIQLPEFKSKLTEDDTFADEQSLEEWKNETRQVLHKLEDALKSADLQKLTADELASVYCILQSLINSEDWMSKDLANIATEILKQLPPPNFEIVKSTMLYHVKPLFAKVPHTLVDPQSGRSLHRPAGGPSGSLDFYESQDWKRRPGLSYLIIWCIQSLKRDEYEQVWHLIVPPSMTFLDDYESYYKLKGIEIISQFIDRVPTELLKRTGIDGLIKKSLNSALLHLHSPLTPKIIQLSVSTLIRLITMTSSPGSQERFDQLCALLGDGIIGSIWIYAYQDLMTIESSLIVSCELVEELGIGTVRYLKPTVHQIVQYLSSEAGPYVVQLQIATLKLLKVVLTVCRPRIPAWSTMILDGVLRCWVSSQEQTPRNEELTGLLIQLANDLITAVPSLKVHCQTLFALDKQMFAPLFPHECTA